MVHWLWYTLPLLYVPGIERILGGPRPQAEAGGLLQAKRPLAVAAHPDDLEYFCGGTLHQLAHGGAEVTAVVATRGEAGGDPVRRRAEAQEAGALLGFHRLHLLDFPDRNLTQQIPRLRQALDSILGEARPDLLLTFDPEHPFPIYHHPDHVAAARAALSLWQGPTLLFHTRRPNLAVDITANVPIKVTAFAAHRSQLPPRGATKVVGWHLYRRHRNGATQYVEVFRQP